MVEDLQTESLALRGRPQIGLEAICVDDRYKSLDRVQRRARLRDILGDMTPAASENSVDRRYAVRRCLDLDVVDRLHQPWSSLETIVRIRRATHNEAMLTMRKDE